MRRYGSIHTKFWTNSNIQKISDQAKLLAAYLLSSSHTTMLGCFRIPIGYIAEDLKWDAQVVIKALDELCDINLLSYDKNNSWIFIHHFLKYNPIENPNQGRSIAKLFDEIPKNTEFLIHLMDALLINNNFLTEEFNNFLLTLSKQFRNQDQEQDQEQNQKQEDMSGKPDTYPQDFCFEKPESQSKNNMRHQAIEILNFLNEKTKRAYRPVDSNLKLIMARLKTGATVMDCRQVIAKKTREWRGNAKMAEYLRPETLFNATKFEQYIGELVEPEDEVQDEFN